MNEETGEESDGESSKRLTGAAKRLHELATPLDVGPKYGVVCRLGKPSVVDPSIAINRKRLGCIN